MQNGTSPNSSVLYFSQPTFSIADYIVFSLFLCISGGVGIFYSLRGQKSTEEYFFGGRKMHAVPVGISTGVSFLSAAMLVGAPAEVYINGYSSAIGAVFGSLGYFVGCIIVASILQPLRMTSVNEYISKRFGSKLLTYIANVAVLLCILQYMGVCMLGSVIAFSSATGGEVSVIVALTIGGVVATFYTSIGGLKAVVWTDVIQSVFMVGGIVAVIVKSIIDTPGGLPEIFRLNLKYGRIHQPTWSFDPTIRHTFWGISIAYFVYWGMFSVQPAGVQRLCSTKSKRDSYIVAAIASGLFLAFGLLPALAGVNIFAYYISKGCDIHAAGWIQSNEIILYFVRERLNVPGFQGMFIAALYAGSLSSLSSCLNSASAILWKDTIKPVLKVEMSEVKATLISKIIVLAFGLAGMFWCYVLHKIGGLIIQLSASIDASVYGTYMSLFFVPLSFQYINYKGATAGVVVSFAVTATLGIGSLLYASKRMTNMLTTTLSCQIVSSNITAENSTVLLSSNGMGSSECRSFIQTLLSLSYEWLPLICILVFLLVSLCVSGSTRESSTERVDEKLLLPVCQKGCWPSVRSRRRRQGNDSKSEECEEEAKKMCASFDLVDTDV